MSSILVESPVQSSQLYFTWVSQADPAHSEFQPIRNFKSPKPEAAAPTNQGSQSLVAKSEQTETRVVREKPSANQSRMAQPVKLGSLMIKLLKRYGISDAEIAEGLSNYAAANC